MVSTAIGQEPATVVTPTIEEVSATSILDDATDQLPNLKVEDIESTILSADDPLPEIKNEEVEVIISDLIENPEQHLQLDDNDDIIGSLESELDELVNKENAAAKEEEEARVKAEQELLTQVKDELILKEEDEQTIIENPNKPPVETESPVVDPFEFQEDPDIIHLTKPTGEKSSTIQSRRESSNLFENEDKKPQIAIQNEENEIKTDPPEETKKENQPGSVEIVEVVVMDDEEIKELNKSQIEDIVHCSKSENSDTKLQYIKTEIKEEIKEEPTSISENVIKEPVIDDQADSIDFELKSEDNKEAAINLENEDTSRRPTFTPEYSEDIFDEIHVEVTKIDKSGKAKRDYSRTKKKEDKELDIFLAVDKVVNAHLADDYNESFSEKDDLEVKKLDVKNKIKIENDRSNSPWTEEEEISSIRTRRRYSTPATPIDSVPNSPASSINYDEDREYRNWKKSVMLVYSRLATHKYASLFLKPITDEQAPGYHSVIHRPMDLQTVRRNIENASIKTTTEFQRDILLMFNNAIMYNKTNEVVYKMAQEMQQESIEHIQILLQAQQDTPIRRETRTSEPGSKRKRGPEENARNKKRKED